MNTAELVIKKSSPAVATEILNQLGGRRFIAMTGSKNFVYDNESLTMKLCRNKAGAQYLNIKLNSLDLYDMVFCRFNSRTGEKIVKAERNNLYNDMLQSVFTNITGLNTVL